MPSLDFPLIHRRSKLFFLQFLPKQATVPGAIGAVIAPDASNWRRLEGRTRRSVLHYGLLALARGNLASVVLRVARQRDLKASCEPPHRRQITSLVARCAPDPCRATADDLISAAPFWGLSFRFFGPKRPAVFVSLPCSRRVAPCLLSFVFWVVFVAAHVGQQQRRKANGEGDKTVKSTPSDLRRNSTSETAATPQRKGGRC